MIENEIEVIELDSEKIESMIYYVRGQKVILDFELAEIYGYETKSFNRQVKNNIDKFDDDFRFQLTKEEYDYLVRCKNCTSRIWANGKYDLLLSKVYKNETIIYNVNKRVI